MRIAVSGGAGYIGSHTVVSLLEAGQDVLILDRFVNAEADVPNRIAEIAGRVPEVEKLCITESEQLGRALRAFRPDAVIHFAGLKAVGEAVAEPLEYYRVNVSGSVALFKEMAEIGCDRLVFASSATVYGEPDQVPIPEHHALRPTNPYGHSNRMVEQIVEDWGAASPALAALALTGPGPGVQPINVGTGRGYSVLEMIRAFEAVSGMFIPYTVTSRRTGDIATSLADPTRAETVMDRRAVRGLDEMCRDAWAWQRGRNK